MIVAKDLTRQFGPLFATRSMNFTIPQGGVVGFLGPNGAGKTTTIRMIAGYLPPSAGQVSVNGVDVATAPQAARRQIGYLPESTPLYPELRVKEYLDFRGRLVGLRRPDRRKAIESALSRCALQDVGSRLIHQLSKGYRQRVGLAAALLHDPPVIILDEPTVGLDPTQIRAFRQLMRDLAGEHTVLLSTHILPEAELSCDRLLLIHRGEVQAQGTIAELRDQADARCVVESAAAIDDLVRPLPGVTGVSSRRGPDTWYTTQITTTGDGGAVAEQIGAAVSAAGIALRELRRERPSLEQLFVRTIAGSDEHHQPSGSEDAA